MEIWSRLYCDKVRSVVVETKTGPSDDEENPVFPYEKLEAIVGDGHNWKWPRMWQHLDEIERRGAAYREGEELHFGQPNKNPNIVPMNVLVCGGGPVRRPARERTARSVLGRRRDGDATAGTTATP